MAVSGTVTIQGTTTWNCKVNCVLAGGVDAISSDNLITIGGQTTFNAKAINVPNTGVPRNRSWTLLLDPPNTAIAGAFGTTTLAFNDGTGNSWTIFVPPKKDSWSLK